MTTAVCDSGPLTHLWQIEMWPAFGTFAELHLATQVVKEVEEHVPLADLQQLSGCAVSHHPVPQQKVDLFVSRTKLDGQLDLADLATMVLAEEIKPDLVLTDDLTLRRAVESGMHVPMGSVGILMRAYKAQLVDMESLHQAIDRLFVHSTLYLSPTFKGYVQKLIAEAIQDRAL